MAEYRLRDLVSALAKEYRITQSDARSIITFLEEQIMKELLNENSVNLPDFGTFSTTRGYSELTVRFLAANQFKRQLREKSTKKDNREVE